MDNNEGLLGAAVANNASWCDAVCRSHGYPGTFGPRVWSSPRHGLRLYPNAVTVAPDATVPEVLADAASTRPFAVKDSFACLDLAPDGFWCLVEASWIARKAGTSGPLSDGLHWDTVTSPGELVSWEKAWAEGDSGDGPVFLPGLLSDSRCTVLACRREDAVVGGAVVYAAGGAAGVSNVFSAGLALDVLWADVESAVAALHPDLPLVGWEGGASLNAARQAGFRTVGSLRVWLRS
jgi:hypothetical protein